MLGAPEPRCQWRRPGRPAARGPDATRQQGGRGRGGAAQQPAGAPPAQPGRCRAKGAGPAFARITCCTSVSIPVLMRRPGLHARPCCLGPARSAVVAARPKQSACTAPFGPAYAFQGSSLPSEAGVQACSRHAGAVFWGWCFVCMARPRACPAGGRSPAEPRSAAGAPVGRSHGRTQLLCLVPQPLPGFDRGPIHRRTTPLHSAAGLRGEGGEVERRTVRRTHEPRAAGRGPVSNQVCAWCGLAI